jgi:hypothetical protein
VALAGDDLTRKEIRLKKSFGSSTSKSAVKLLWCPHTESQQPP